MAFDGGALRMGWAVLEPGPTYLASGLAGLVKEEDEKDQAYRFRLIDYWIKKGFELLDRWEPDVAVFETFPLHGGPGFSENVQGKLANSAVTALQTVCAIHGTPMKQVAAITVKARIGPSKKATKAKVRDGVISLLPELAPRKSEWTSATKNWDEPDAIAVGLVSLGHTNR